MTKSKRKSRKTTKNLWKTLLIALPIITGLILAIAQLLNALPDSVFNPATPTQSRKCQYIGLDTQRTTITLTSSEGSLPITLFRGVTTNPKSTYLIDVEDMSSNEVGKIKFQYNDELDQFEITTIVDPYCDIATQVGVPPLTSIIMANGNSKVVTIKKTVFEFRLTYLKDEQFIQGTFILK